MAGGPAEVLATLRPALDATTAGSVVRPLEAYPKTLRRRDRCRLPNGLRPPLFLFDRVTGKRPFNFHSDQIERGIRNEHAPATCRAEHHESVSYWRTPAEQGTAIARAPDGRRSGKAHQGSQG